MDERKQKYEADNKKLGITLREVISMAEHAKGTRMDLDRTVLRTGATGIKGQVRHLEFVEMPPDKS